MVLLINSLGRGHAHTDGRTDGQTDMHARMHTHRNQGHAGLKPVLNWFKKISVTIHSQIPCTAYICIITIINVSLTERKGHAFKR